MSHLKRSTYLSAVHEQLSGEVRAATSMIASEDPPQNIALEEAKRILSKMATAEFTIDDAKQVELQLLRLVPHETLVAKASSILTEYKLVHPEAVIADNRFSETEPEMFREKLIEIKRQINLNLLARRQRWDYRVRLSTGNMIVFLFCSMLFLASAKFKWFPSSTVFLVFLCGVIGGTISAQQRVITAEGASERWVAAFDGYLPFWNVVLSPLLGGMGALIIFILILAETPSLLFSEKVKDLIPTNLLCPPGAVKNFWLCVTDCIPADGGTAAKLMLLSMLAGFSERLVPDLLDRLKQKQ